MSIYLYTDNEVRSLLKKLRKKRKLSQLEVANKLNVTKGYISQIELGKTTLPKYRVLIKLITIYGMKPKHFEKLLATRD